MREEWFWEEVNEARATGESRLWKNAFPEANVLDMNCLVEVNQYLATVSGANPLAYQHQTMMSPVHWDERVKPFYSEFLSNFERQGTETDWNSFFFFSTSDEHQSLNLHGDTESVLLIQGYGDVGMVTYHQDKPGKIIHHMETGDALLLPPLYIHKPVPIGPRVTLSLGAIPKHYSAGAPQTNPNRH